MNQLSHKQVASECFNKVWDLLDMPNRTEKEAEEMVHLCHTSFWHWSQAKEHTEQNLSIGYWQLSRVYAVVGNGEQALYYANRCIEVSIKAELAPFYIAYAYEAQARAYIVLDRKKLAEDSIVLVKKHTEQVIVEDSKNLLVAELAELLRKI
ncbi:hypothetical protein [Ferdinandcohnia sp. Marseille-Q9671]